MSSPARSHPLAHGSCFCKAVTFHINDMDAANCAWNMYCHCTICQRISGAPFVHSIGFRNGAITFNPPLPEDSDESNSSVLGIYHTSTFLSRIHCKRCGTNLGGRGRPSANNPDSFLHGVVSVMSGVLAPEIRPKFQPQGHVMYKFRITESAANDGLPKFDEFPGEN
ncbi:Mss4-like protein [Polychytrium aggregatum]|uniref:Mss4-like protein n=1 Tax=Polychytrium aggregatum TaxID=110093 RepID=UPI0022FDEFCA|nr:Mss4-like protein [Polychytrium aggregatum]KAI9204154.1 Mss4-like protein [Polychytrium aggregatum]